MSKAVEKKYDWYHNDQKYTLFEYINEINELISSATNQMQECDGDLFMSEYQKLMLGSFRLSYLCDQLKKEKTPF